MTEIKDKSVDLPIVIAELRDRLREKANLTAAVRTCMIDGLQCRVSVARSGEVELQADGAALPSKAADRVEPLKKLSALAAELRLERFNLGEI